MRILFLALCLHVISSVSTRVQTSQPRSATRSTGNAPTKATPTTVIEKARDEANASLVDWINKSDSSIIMKLNPYHADTPKGKGDYKEFFHGFGVIQSLSVSNADKRLAIGASLGKTLHWDEQLKSSCFLPRHGLRICRGKLNVDLVICFECGRMKLYTGEKDIGIIDLPNGKRLPGEIALLKTSWEYADLLLSQGEASLLPIEK